MGRPAIVIAGIVLLAGCTATEGLPEAFLDFRTPPKGLVQARPVQIDGRPIKAELSRTEFGLAPGVHRVLVVPARGGGQEEKAEPPPPVSVLLQPESRHFIALRATPGDGWEVVSWGEPAPEAGPPE